MSCSLHAWTSKNDKWVWWGRFLFTPYNRPVAGCVHRAYLTVKERKTQVKMNKLSSMSFIIESLFFSLSLCCIASTLHHSLVRSSPCTILWKSHSYNHFLYFCWLVICFIWHSKQFVVSLERLPFRFVPTGSIKVSLKCTSLKPGRQNRPVHHLSNSNTTIVICKGQEPYYIKMFKVTNHQQQVARSWPFVSQRYSTVAGT